MRPCVVLLEATGSLLLSHKDCQPLVIEQMSRQESRSSAGPDHLTEHALFTWLITHLSRDSSCTDHVTDHALIT